MSTHRCARRVNMTLDLEQPQPMQTLIIGSQELKRTVRQALDSQGSVLWAPDLMRAFEELEVSDIDLIVIDARTQAEDIFTDLKALIFGIPVTTRVMAIVEHLPEEEVFAESGVIYLTPPVNLQDINWFIRHHTANQ